MNMNSSNQNKVNMLDIVFGNVTAAGKAAKAATTKKAPDIKVGRFGGMFGVYDGYVCVSTHLTEGAAKAAEARL